MLWTTDAMAASQLLRNNSQKVHGWDTLAQMFRIPTLSRWRIFAAMAVALAADGLQFSLLGAPPFAEIIDVIAMVLTALLIGFHVLLLPTFVVELFPLVDMLPTWTACTAAVIVFRKREQRTAVPPKSHEANESIPPPRP
jgi:hypothetical protein